MRDGSDQLLLLMEKEARSYIDTDKLKDLLRWAHKETVDSVSDIKPISKRALAIAIAYTEGARINESMYIYAYTYYILTQSI